MKRYLIALTFILSSFVTSFSQSEMLALVKKKDAGWQYINEKGEAIIEDAGMHPNDFSEGLLKKVTSEGVGYQDCHGQWKIKPAFRDGRAFANGYARVKKEKWGFIDSNGTTVTEFIYDANENFSEGLAAVKINNLWGYIDTKGQLEFLQNSGLPTIFTTDWQL